MTTFIRRFVCAIVSCPFLMRYLRNNQLTHWNRCKMVTYHICRLILGCRFHWQLAGEVSSVLTVDCKGLTLQCHNQLMETVSISVGLVILASDWSDYANKCSDWLWYPPPTALPLQQSVTGQKRSQQSPFSSFPLLEIMTHWNVFTRISIFTGNESIPGS